MFNTENDFFKFLIYHMFPKKGVQYIDTCDFYGYPNYKYGNMLREFGCRVDIKNNLPVNMYDLICFSNVDRFRTREAENNYDEFKSNLRKLTSKLRYGGYLFLDTKDNKLKEELSESQTTYCKSVIWNYSDYNILFYRKTVNEEYGVPRFYYIDRHKVGEIQKEMLRHAVWSMAEDTEKTIVIGGPSGELRLERPELNNKVDTINLDSESRPYGHMRADRPLPIANNVYSLIESCHAIEHMENPLDTLKEWVRILKPGGLMLLIIPDKDYHRHDMNPNFRIGDRCFTELSALEWKEQIFDKLDNVDILQFNRKQNNFDFEVILKKKK